MSRPKLNRELLRKTAARLRRLRHEEHYDQGIFLSKTDCGTVCCIAGHVLLASGGRVVANDYVADDVAIKLPGKRQPQVVGLSGVGTEAKRLLGLNDLEARCLFAEDGSSWPDDFRERFYDVLAKVSGERPSRIAADLLDALADGKVRLG